MKFGFITLDFKRFPLERCFSMASDYGFDGIEIWGGRPHAYPWDMDAGAIRQIVDFKKKYKIEVPMYTPAAIGMPVCLCSPMEKEREEAILYFKRAVDVASDIEAPRMLVVADHPGYEQDRRKTWGYLVDSVRELTGYALKKGVRVTIEPLTPMESPIVTQADDCVKLISDVNMPNLYAMMDVVPPTIANEPFSEYFAKLGERMDYIHICNSDGKTDAHLGLDTGVIPVADMFRLFKHWHYEGYVTAELYSVSFRDPELFLAGTARILKEMKLKLNI
jgi:protein FrlC